MRYIKLLEIDHEKTEEAVTQAHTALPEDSTPQEHLDAEKRVRDSLKVSYKDLLRIIVAAPPRGQEAMSTDDMEQAADVLAVLEGVDVTDDVLALENSAYKFVLTKVEATGWKYADKRFAQFVRDVRSAPTEAPTTE